MIQELVNVIKVLLLLNYLAKSVIRGPWLTPKNVFVAGAGERVKTVWREEEEPLQQLPVSHGLGAVGVGKQGLKAAAWGPSRGGLRGRGQELAKDVEDGIDNRCSVAAVDAALPHVCQQAKDPVHKNAHFKDGECGSGIIRRYYVYIYV